MRRLQNLFSTVFRIFHTEIDDLKGEHETPEPELQGARNYIHSSTLYESLTNFADDKYRDFSFISVLKLKIRLTTDFRRPRGCRMWLKLRLTYLVYQKIYIRVAPKKYGKELMMTFH